MLLFALSLAQQGLSLGTVKGYLSFPLAFLRLPDQCSLYKSPVVTRFLKCLQHMFPSAPFGMPQWDRNLVLTSLCVPFFDLCTVVISGYSPLSLFFSGGYRRCQEV